MLRVMVVILTCLAASLSIASAGPAMTQTPADGWSKPAPIAQTEGQLSLGALVSDGSGHLHLFYVDRPDESVSGAINYLRWDETGWSQPIDLILDPETDSPYGPRAVIDSQQTIHLIWGGANRSLRYAHAPLAEVGSARAWSRPQTLERSLPASHDIITALGDLYVVYADLSEQGVVCMIKSDDFGSTWVRPTVIAEMASGTAAGDVRLAIDGMGRLHAVWTEYQLPDGWPPTGVFYSRSLDGGKAWSTPLQIVGATHAQIGVAAVGNDDIHLVWRSTVGGDGTFHQFSGDGGDSWLSADRLDDRGGMSGLPSFAVDTAGTLHYVIGPVFYAAWAKGSLSPYQDVATEPVRAQAAKSFGEQGIIAITSGNRLHVIFEVDFTSVWYTSQRLDVPALPSPTTMPPPSPIATAGAMLTLGMTKTPSPDPQATQMVLPIHVSYKNPTSSRGLVVGALSAAVLIVVAIGGTLLWRRRQ